MALRTTRPPGNIAHVAARRILVAAFPRVQSLDALGPAEVFSVADRITERGAYEVEVVSSAGGPIQMSNGLRIETAPLHRGPIDTLIIAGGQGTREALGDAR